MEKSKLEDLREEIIKLSKLIDKKLMILINVNCNDTEFLKSIQNDFSQNLYFTISFIEGLQKPEKTYFSHGISKKCYHGNDSPHLYHTFNPQLNSIVDMLEEILVSIKFQRNKEKENPKEEKFQNIINITDLKVKPPLKL